MRHSCRIHQNRLLCYLSSKLTYASCLSHVLQKTLGRDEEVEEAAEPISMVSGLQDTEKLAEDRGRGDVEGRVKHSEGVLNRGIEGLWVLRGERRNGPVLHHSMNSLGLILLQFQDFSLTLFPHWLILTYC